MTDQTIDYNTATALKANTFERTGYSFLGWATSASGTQVYYDEEEVTLTKKVTTLYAVWEKNSWKVWFTTPSGATTVTANGVSTSPLTVEYGETVTIVITPDAEHVIGTVTATGGASLSGEDGTRTFTMPDADVAISITMADKPTYTINFINMGETISSQQVMEGQAAEKPANPTACEGYSFVGWWNDELATTNTTAETWITTFTATSDQNYYAVYSHSEGGGGGGTSEVASVTFVTVGSDSNTDLVDEYSGISTFSGSKLYAGTAGVKLGSGSANGSITLNLPSAATVKTVKVTAKKYGSDTGTLSVKAGSTDIGSAQTPPSSTGELTFTATSAVEGATTITVATSSKRAYISSIVVIAEGGGGSTTYYTTDPTCTPCENKVTLTKGAESHGTFTLDKADGAHNNCTSNFVVTVSNITPEDGYRFVNVTATGGNNEVTGPDGSGNFTSTITANFEEIPSHTVTWHSNGDESNTATYKEGQAIVFPETATGCDGKTFMGWSAVAVPEQDDAPVYTTSALMGTSDVTYYAVFATASGSGGGAWDGTTPGTYKIYAIVDEEKYYATASMSSGKLASTTNVAEAADFTFAVYNSGWSIKTGTTYITYSSSTNLGTSGSAYIWELSSGVKGTWRFTSETSGRGWIYRAGQDVFGGYSTGNVTAGGNEYYDLEIGSGSGTTYSGYTTSCTTCENKVTLTKGEETNGTFTLNKADGAYNNCTSNFVVTVSNITPESGYYCTGVTATGGHNTVTGPDGSGNYTVTYEKGNAIESIITANFAPNPTYTVTWSANGDDSYKVQYEEGDAIVFPGTATGCDGKVFRGWSAVTVAETDVEPSYVTSATMPAHNVTYYAVYAEASGSGGTPTTETYGFEDADDDTNWTIDANITKSSSAKATGTYGGIINTDETYIYFNNKVKVTNFSFKLARTSKNSNYYVKIEISTDGSVWTEAETYLMSSFANGSFTSKSKDFDGSTELYVRLYCYNTTAVRYIDDISITYGGGTTYTGYTTTCGAGISAQNIGWITTSASQKVKRVINVSAKNFEDDVTLAASCANSHFEVTLGATAVPAGPAGLTTTLTVEYTPTAQGREENVEIELTAGDKSRTITVSGRCVPDEFLLITKKSSTWYALPANMATSGEHDGIEVSPNDATTPTVVPVSPSNAIYSLASVANSRYADNGHCVRLVGNDKLCLWSNMAESATKTYIQNKTQVATAATDNHDWLLSTTDGVHYTIANPHHPQYEAGRRLAYGTKFGMYAEETEFFIVSAGCSSQPGEVTVSPRRIEATFSWVSNASSMTIDLYTNELMTEGHLTATASSSPYVFTGLEESKPYWYKLTPGTDIDCAVTGSFITTGPIVDIVEWQENGVVLYIDKGDITPLIVIDGQEEHGSISGGGGNATELFFAKYFEGAGNMKLLSIFNGTKDAISLANYKFEDYHAGSGATSYGSTKTYELASLGSINAGQEIIFFSRQGGTDALATCSNPFLNDKITNYSSAESNPRWVECASDKFAGKIIEFNGNDAIVLKKGDAIIDVIGALNEPGQGDNCNNEDAWEGSIKNMDKGKSPSDPVFDAFYEASSKSPVSTKDSIDILNGFGINLTADEIDISTARCIFFRDKRVQNGDSAVTMNTDDFVTFTNHTESGTNYKAEWYGRSVCMTAAMKTAAGVSNDAQATCNSYQDIANMDYNEYYIDWTNINPGTALTEFTHDPNTNEYTIDIDNMRQHACLNLRFQLVHEGNVLTEATQQVPIVVVGNVDTNDPLFSELVEDKTTHEKLYPQSLARCADCDVVILGSASLTKGSDSDPKDVPEVGNVKVYPGGKLVVPTGTNYTMKSLALRRQEDAVASADVQGTITFSAPAPAPARKDVGEKPIRKTPTGTKKTYFDLRVDPTNWHYISLPYDCDVADIRYANPEETDVPVLGTDYLIKWYNGEKRAATQAGGCWEMVAADATLKAGLGYIFSIPGEGSVRREFRFPMDNEVIAQEKANKMVNGVYSYGGDQDFSIIRANHRGWNLLGNPYMLPYSSDITDPLMTGYIVPDYPSDPEEIWDGHYKFDEDPTTHTYLRYIVEPIDNGWSGYTQVAIASYEMKPFTSYFVQIGGDHPEDPQGINFHVASVSHSPVRRAPAEYEELEDRHPVWCAVTLTNPKGEKDETTLLISDNFTDGYDMMDDLTKWRGTYYQYAQITTKPVLASRNNEGEMAFNALPDSSALAGVPLNYFAASQGFYTFAYDDKYDRDMEVKEVKLWDKTTNQWYNLMYEPYSFSTARTDNKDRFVLSVRVERKHNQTTTDLENVGTYKGDKPRKLLINGLLYIQRGKDVYDVTGKQLLNR